MTNSVADEKRISRSARTPVRVSYEVVGRAMAICDVILIFAAAQIASLGYHSLMVDADHDTLHYTAIGFVFAALVVPFSQLRGVYDPIRMGDTAGQILKLIAIWFSAFAFLTLCAFALKIGASFSRGGISSVVGCSLLLLIGNRVFWSRYLRTGLSSGAVAARRVALISDGSEVNRQQLLSRLEQWGCEIVRHVNIPGEVGGKHLARETIDRAIAQFRGLHLDEIVVSTSLRRLTHAARVAEGLRVLPLPVRLVIDPSASAMALKPVRMTGGFLTVQMQRAPLSAAERALKRAIDISVAGTALFLLSPLLVMTALAIKLDSRGPVLFRQTRHGFNNTPFRILKFRSMRVMEDGDNGQAGHAQRFPRDPHRKDHPQHQHR